MVIERKFWMFIDLEKSIKTKIYLCVNNDVIFAAILVTTNGILQYTIRNNDILIQ